MSRQRLDAALVEQGLATGRDKAKALIMAGLVYVNGHKALKPGDEIASDAQVEVRGQSSPYVSRGGLKLEKAMTVFGVSVAGKICADIGASTGGFTDCMLQNGALLVYAVDVGYGQLDWKLRNDDRVVVLERTNARYLTRKQIPQPLGLVSVDVSFISLTLILPAVHALLEEGGGAVCLIKPQFEAGRDKVGKRGVVREPGVHREVIEKVDDFARSAGLGARGVSYSPIKGPQGNIEYLIHLVKGGEPAVTREDISQAVEEAHAQLS